MLYLFSNLFFLAKLSRSPAHVAFLWADALFPPSTSGERETRHQWDDLSGWSGHLAEGDHFLVSGASTRQLEFFLICGNFIDRLDTNITVWKHKKKKKKKSRVTLNNKCCSIYVFEWIYSLVTNWWWTYLRAKNKIRCYGEADFSC